MAPRQTQAERSESTINRILDATVECLVELGYSRTSTLVVHERAGISRGALLHHFPLRAELMAAAVDHMFEQMQATIDVTSGSQGDPVDRAVRTLWSTFTSNLGVAAQELLTAARTDPELRTALVRREADLNRRIHAMFGRVFGPELVSRPLYDTTFRLLAQAMRGAAATRALHPDASARPDLIRWAEVATRLLAVESL
ncbi:MAG TPA: helix-turn-helix domain-containing protein [Mycobacteriales bacterium]|nr:helix-turn-helix domain-containing protein [Mycobacteriales bacterium]